MDDDVGFLSEMNAMRMHNRFKVRLKLVEEICKRRAKAVTKGDFDN